MVKNGTRSIEVVAAMTRTWVIGQQEQLPWHLPEELRFFRDLTLGHTLVMGRKTFEAIGRPLPGRRTLVLSRTLQPRPGLTVCRSMAEGLAEAAGDRLFLVGGVRVYRQGLELADYLHISWVRGHYAGDIRFPPLHPGTWQVDRVEDHGTFRYVGYRRRKG